MVLIFTIHCRRKWIVGRHFSLGVSKVGFKKKKAEGVTE